MGLAELNKLDAELLAIIRRSAPALLFPSSRETGPVNLVFEFEQTADNLRDARVYLTRSHPLDHGDDFVEWCGDQGYCLINIPNRWSHWALGGILSLSDDEVTELLLKWS